MSDSEALERKQARIAELEAALAEIRDANPDAPWVESWKFLARWMAEKAKSALRGEGK